MDWPNFAALRDRPLVGLARDRDDDATAACGDFLFYKKVLCSSVSLASSLPSTPLSASSPTPEIFKLLVLSLLAVLRLWPSLSDRVRGQRTLLPSQPETDEQELQDLFTSY